MPYKKTLVLDSKIIVSILSRLLNWSDNDVTSDFGPTRKS